MGKLSVIIITHNEAHDIRRCLESVRFADEIIVFDSGSTDGTQAICREYTKKVFETDWPGYGKQKNRALQEATSEWILSIDADEWVSDTLHLEIASAIQSEKNDAYHIHFQMICFRRIIKHGAWRKYHLRLFKKSRGKFDDALIHEKIILDGRIGRLTSPIFHETYRDLDEMLEKLNRYTTSAAKRRLQEGKIDHFAIVILNSFWIFFRAYILKLGFLDGKAGLALAFMSAEYCYYRYLKLCLLHHKEKSKTACYSS
jgi:glycosyltransferase involved in cell wall biosynthesis